MMTQSFAQFIDVGPFDLIPAHIIIIIIFTYMSRSIKMKTLSPYFNSQKKL